MPKSSSGPIDVIVGAHLRACREAVRMNQNMAGRVLDVTQQQMTKYESGEDRLLFTHVCELVATFGKPLEQFVREMKLPNSNPRGLREIEQASYTPPASKPEAKNAASGPGEAMSLDLSALDNPKDRQCVKDYFNAWVRKQMYPQITASRPTEPMLLDLAALDNPKDRESVRRYYYALVRKHALRNGAANS